MIFGERSKRSMNEFEWLATIIGILGVLYAISWILLIVERICDEKRKKNEIDDVDIFDSVVFIDRNHVCHISGYGDPDERRRKPIDFRVG
jgi:hypothetical protein